MSTPRGYNTSCQDKSKQVSGLRMFPLNVLALSLLMLPFGASAQGGNKTSDVASNVNRANQSTVKNTAENLRHRALEKQFDAAIAPYFTADMPGATVIVTRDGKTEFRKAYGLADVEQKKVMQAEMVLRIGSISKQFTATAILQLVAAGKLKLNDDVNQLLPDFPLKGQKISVEHLLTHTSGVKNYLAMPNFSEIASKPVSVKEMFDFFKNEALEFTPGDRFSYSNSGYFLLGLIIEKVSGMQYADYLAKHIFTPLKMQHTAYEGFERNGQKRVEGYVVAPDGAHKVQAMSVDIGYAAGALVSTVDDLARWDRAITENKLLPAASWQQVMRPHLLNGGQASGYGYGWMITKIQGVDAFAHDGLVPGFNAFAMRVPEQKVYVAVLSNNARMNPNAAYLVEKMAAIAIGKPFPEYQAIQLEPKSIDKVVGVYKMNEKEDRIITRSGNQVFMQRSGRAKLEIFPYSETGFFIKNHPARVHMRFEKNASDDITHMVFVQNNEENALPRTPATANTVVVEAKSEVISK